MFNNFSMKDSETQKYFTTISDFEFLKNTTVGKGSFGTVVLALHLKTSKIYAIKIIDLESVTTEVGIRALQRQIKFHTLLDHPHIVKLWEIFEQNNKVYMVMEYVQNGNLFYYQNSMRIFPEAEASIFFSQTLSAIQYMHENNLMHRDLKPQNLLLDKDYNIKICDFGWVVSGITEKRKIFCGTYEYMAPEMIFDQPYDYKIDIWAVGVLLYELLHGFAPFEGETVAQVRKQMLKGEIQLDPRLSEQVQDLIYSILKLNPQERLSIAQIKQHSWMKKNEALKLKNLRSLNSTFEPPKQQALSKNKIQELSQNCQKKHQQENQQENRQLKSFQKARRQEKHKNQVDSSEMGSSRKIPHQQRKMKKNYDNSIQIGKTSQKNINRLHTSPNSYLPKQRHSKIDNRSNKENENNLENSKKKSGDTLLNKKKSLGNFKYHENVNKNYEMKSGHRPQNSDLTSYENPGKMKKQSRLKTDQQIADLGYQASIQSKKYTKPLTRFQTQVNDGVNLYLTKKREKYSSKAAKLKKNCIQTNKTLQFTKPSQKQKYYLNVAKTDSLSYKYLRKSID